MKINLTINQRLILTLILLLIFLVGLTIPLLILNYSINKISYQVDLAGRNRMLSQRIAANAMMWKSTNDKAKQADAKKKLTKAYNLLKKSLDVLEKGGPAPGYDTYMLIEAANEEEKFQINLVKELLEQQEKEFYTVLLTETAMRPTKFARTDTLWQSAPTNSVQPKWTNALATKTPSFELRQRTIDTLVENLNYSKAFDKFVNSYSDSNLLNACVELVKTYTKKNNEANSFLFKYLLFAGIFIVVGILLTIRSCFRIVKSIRKPVGETIEVLQSLSSGNLPEKLVVIKNDELSEMLHTVNKLIDNMHEVVNYTQEVGNGNLTNQITLFNNQGPIYESLEKMRSNLLKAEQEDAKRAWFNQGLAELGDLLRKHQNNNEKLYTELIKFIVQYLGANQGAIFLVNDDNEHEKFMELISFYGYEKHRFLEKKVGLNEGLVGQTYLDKEPIYLTEVPKFYTKITSGIGEATPNCLVLFPLMFNDIVIGVLEIASFEVLSEYKVKLLERISENVASIISTVKSTLQTQRLLEVSQQQSEELMSQEEEMRQNVEELRAKHEEMRRITQENVDQRRDIEDKHKLLLQELKENKSEMEEQVVVLSETMAYLEMDKNGFVQNANTYFLKCLNYTLEEVKGKHLLFFMGFNDTTSDEYQVFWQRLQNRDIVKGEFTYIGTNKKQVVFLGCHKLLVDSNNQPRKLILLGQDINYLKGI